MNINWEQWHVKNFTWRWWYRIKCQNKLLGRLHREKLVAMVTDQSPGEGAWMQHWTVVKVTPRNNWCHGNQGAQQRHTCIGFRIEISKERACLDGKWIWSYNFLHQAAEYCCESFPKRVACSSPTGWFCECRHFKGEACFFYFVRKETCVVQLFCECFNCHVLTERCFAVFVGWGRWAKNMVQKQTQRKRKRKKARRTPTKTMVNITQKLHIKSLVKTVSTELNSKGAFNLNSCFH